MKCGTKVKIYGFCNFENDWDMHEGDIGYVCGIDSIDKNIIQVRHDKGKCWVHIKQIEIVRLSDRPILKKYKE